MCGICGAWHQNKQPVTQNLLQQMNERLLHRGPDGAGYHLDAAVGLAMRRLSIIDVAGSDQPLFNEDRSLAVVFNGEIYNYRALRHNLQQQGHRFHTEGDGETIVHLYEQYGLDAPTHLRGQFALALWDSREQRLLLARDRFGQKPLYYYHDSEIFVFASEIKALLQHPQVPCRSAFEGEAGTQTLALYLSYGAMPYPQTAFEGIQQLPPGYVLWLDADGRITQQPYWELPELAPVSAGAMAQQEAYVERLREQLRIATELRMIADVPLGAFLSGGLDSSLIVALMQQMTNQQVKTFSIGFAGDDSFDETPYAQQVARHLETDHTAFTVQPDALSLLDKLVWHHDQPFADSSAIPTFLVSELTRQHVTVALTGDGGDELFAGYERFYAAALMQRLDFVPKSIWHMGAKALKGLPEGTGYANGVKRGKRFFDAAALEVGQAYFDLIRVLRADLIMDLLGLSDDLAYQHFKQVHLCSGQDLAHILRANQSSYLVDDLLVKADRCSMAASLEARAPFLDHELAEFAATIPLNLKLKGRTTKHILKEAARGLLPDDIIDRRKHGFGVPLGAWLRRDMSPVRDLLLSETARQRGLFDHMVITRLIDEHTAGQRDHNRQLWTLLTLESWYRQFID